MPGVSRIQRTEAKYNVTLDFPQLGLHSAAAAGNLGLVKYALDHGQPINSVLDGVLPLHVACSGGSDQVVQLLIDNGADVNAPRLPRRYSSDKSRDASAPIIGTSGSTPLHFASANGHTTVVSTLLLHGAHPDRPDKHGITPEMIARQNGWVACAEVLRRWTYDKDKDLRDKEALVPSREPEHNVPPSGDDARHVCSSIGCRDCVSKLLRLKGSVEHSLNNSRPSFSPSASSSLLPDVAHSHSKRSLHSPTRPSFATGVSSFEEVPPRRPSLPHAFAPAEVNFPPSKSSSRPSSRRPRSAGTDAEQSSSSTSQKLKTKISLLSIFKKGYSDTSTTSATPDSMSGFSSFSSAVTSTSPSPVPGQSSGSTSLQHSFDVSSSSVDLTSAAATRSSSSRFRNRLFSEDITRSGHPPSAVDLHHAISQERLQSSSTSASHVAPAVRPGILRPHARSSSSGLSGTDTRRTNSFSQSSARALRFDSESSSPSPSGFSRRTDSQTSDQSSMRLKISHSISSFGGDGRLDSPRSPLGINVEAVGLRENVGVMDSAITDEPEDVLDSDIEEDDEEEEEEYGEPIRTSGGLNLKIEKAPLQRRYSASSSLPSPEVVGPSPSYDFPFSISKPPELAAESQAAAPALRVHSVDNRLRGDSLSSTDTNASAYPSGSSIGVATPSTLQGQNLDPHISSPGTTPLDLPVVTALDNITLNLEVQKKPSSILSGIAKGPRVPLDIDIHSISSHAQAEALVQRAQQRILESQDGDADCPMIDAAFVAAGRTPLSAKLAAYGESLAIKKKFTEEEEGRSQSATGHRRAATAEVASQGLNGQLSSSSHSGTLRGLDRKFSLEERTHSTPRRSKVRRPQTSEGVASPDSSESFLPGTSTPSNEHFSSRRPSEPTSAPPRGDRYRSSRTIASRSPRKAGHTLQASDGTINISPGTSLCRSRTPDPGDMLDFHPSMSMGVPLSRVSTAPAQDCVADVLSPRNASMQGRQAARTNKLLKMGFTAAEAHKASSPSPSVRSAPASKARFGGIKTLVQNFKGKP